MCPAQFVTQRVTNREHEVGDGIIPAMSGKSLFNQPHSEHTNLPSRIKYKEKEIPGLIFP